jgi:hypothetical protein
MSNNNVISAGYIEIVQTQDSKSPELLETSIQEIFRDTSGTIVFPIADSRPLIEDEYTDVKLLFGSWIESGEEDKQLESLYKSRQLPSTSPDE